MKTQQIEFRHVVNEYKTGGIAVRAADDVSFAIGKGELAVILGASGAGILLNTGEQAVQITGTDGKAMGLPDNGVVVSQKYAQENDIHAGDRLRLNISASSGSRTVTVRVAGICRLVYRPEHLCGFFLYPLAGDGYFISSRARGRMAMRQRLPCAATAALTA